MSQEVREGWRLIEDGEMRAIGDEVYRAETKTWEKLTGAHHHIYDLSHPQGMYKTNPCRRRAQFIDAG